MINSAPKASKPPVGNKAQPFGQKHENRSAGQRPYANGPAAEDHREHKIDRALETEIARLDINVMMRE